MGKYGGGGGGGGGGSAGGGRSGGGEGGGAQKVVALCLHSRLAPSPDQKHIDTEPASPGIASV